MRTAFARLPHLRCRPPGARLLRRRLFQSRNTHGTSKSANGGTSPSQAATSKAGFQKIVSRAPKFLRPTLSALHAAPVTHVTAFLLLHEITAIVPLFGLAGAFHYYNWLPPYFAEGKWVIDGVERFGKYFKKKGWIKAGEELEAEREVKEGRNATDVKQGKGLRWWNRGESGVRWVVEFATAYAVVKALMPLRIVVSVWGAPWFARWTVIPLGNSLKRILVRTKSPAPATAANAKPPKEL